MISKFKAAHKMSGLSPEGKLTKADAGLTAMDTSGNFPEANWPLPKASVTKAINDLDLAIKAVATGAPGSVSHMHEMERQLLAVFNLLRSYVEMTANNSTDAKAVIESAGMVAYLSGGGAGPITDLTLTAIGGGVVQINVPRNAGVVAFVYQYSTDGGITWLPLDISKTASYQLKGQTPGATLNFRFAPIAKTQGAFSQPKSIMVV
ncbi:MAG: hypothetical protein IT236_14410 [Bacteroidia bacterium]|nr:hypothetical protein [Bacteroidia bacterium]